ncbi:MAG: RNA-guided endonuclease InsQ/TnpB family protein [Vulcanimicrobiaceae bacterium]
MLVPSISKRCYKRLESGFCRLCFVSERRRSQPRFHRHRTARSYSDGLPPRAAQSASAICAISASISSTKSMCSDKGIIPTLTRWLPGSDVFVEPQGQPYGIVVRHYSVVTRRQGYRFRLKPKQRDDLLLRRFLGCSRFVWNTVLAMNELRSERGEERLGYATMCGYLVYLKGEYPFLREAYSQSLQHTLKDLSRAYQRAFDPNLLARLPRFKKRGSLAGIHFPQGFRIHGQAVYLPKIGWIGFRKSREIEGNIKNVTVSSDGRDWYVAIQTERETEEPLHRARSAVGIDLGVARFAALSDGTFIDGANAFKRLEGRLALLQRRLSRKRRFSANWCKTKNIVLRVHRKIANVRNDFLHKASTTISKNHALVVLEDLHITNMTASARGNVQRPGGNVRAKSALNRRILDQGWGEFRRQLGYKLAWSGGALLLVDPRGTSRTCSKCGDVSAESRQTQAAFRCVACGHACNADTNAAMNILRRAGQARIACGDSSLDGSAKQEAQLVARARVEESSGSEAGEHVKACPLMLRACDVWCTSLPAAVIRAELSPAKF